MKQIKEELSKEKYSEYQRLSYSDREALIEQEVPAQWIYGYGYYGHSLLCRDGKYFIIHTIGNSCD